MMFSRENLKVHQYLKASMSLQIFKVPQVDISPRSTIKASKNNKLLFLLDESIDNPNEQVFLVNLLYHEQPCRNEKQDR